MIHRCLAVLINAVKLVSAVRLSKVIRSAANVPVMVRSANNPDSPAGPAPQQSGNVAFALCRCAKWWVDQVWFVLERSEWREEFCDRCNGMHTPVLCRGGERCNAKCAPGDLLGQQVWANVEASVRNPVEVLEQLQDGLRGASGDAEDTLKQIARLGCLIARKARECSGVVGLFRRGRFIESDPDAQLDEIGTEESALQSQLDEKRRDVASAATDYSAAEMASALLAEIGDCRDGHVSDEVTRRLIEILVAGVRVETIGSEEGRKARTFVSYHFAPRSLPVDLLLPDVRSFTPGLETGAPLTVADHNRKRRL